MKELRHLLMDLIAVLEQQTKHDPCNQCKCGCPTDDTFNASAARYNEQAAQAAAMAQQNAVAQQAAQHAALLKQQADYFTRSAG